VHVVAIVSQKGGSGKSTLSLHLAAHHASRGSKTLLLDMDPQGNLVGWAKRRGDLPPDVDTAHASQLGKVLAAAEADGYDLVILDTAPSADRASLGAVEAANLVLIPCRPAQFDLDAVITSVKLVRMVDKPFAVVLNATPPRSRVTEEAAVGLAQAGAPVSQAIVYQRVALQHCLIDGRTAQEVEPGCPAAREIERLYADMMERLHADKLEAA